MAIHHLFEAIYIDLRRLLSCRTRSAKYLCFNVSNGKILHHLEQTKRYRVED